MGAGVHWPAACDGVPQRQHSVGRGCGFPNFVAVIGDASSWMAGPSLTLRVRSSLMACGDGRGGSDIRLAEGNWRTQ